MPIHPELEVKRLFDQGVKALEAHQPEQALIYLDQALALDRHDPEVWCCRGLVLGHLQRYAESVESFDRTLELSPNDHRALYDKGLVLASVEQAASRSRSL